MFGKCPQNDKIYFEKFLKNLKNLYKLCTKILKNS